MRRRCHLALVCALLSLLLSAGPALAASGHHRHPHHAVAAAHSHTAHSHTQTATGREAASSSGGKATTKDALTVLNDCQNHGQLTRTYPLSWLKKALAIMSPSTSQYSNCSTVLRQAMLHDIHPGSGGSSGGSGTTIIIIVVVVLVILAALLGVLALRRRRGGPPPAAA